MLQAIPALCCVSSSNPGSKILVTVGPNEFPFLGVPVKEYKVSS